MVFTSQGDLVVFTSQGDLLLIMSLGITGLVEMWKLRPKLSKLSNGHSVQADLGVDQSWPMLYRLIWTWTNRSQCYI